MKNAYYENLHSSYSVKTQINLAENKKQFFLVNGISIIITVLYLVLKSFQGTPLPDWGESRIWFFPLILLAGIIIYLVGHEGIHGIVIKLLGGHPYFGYVKGMFFAGDKGYFSKAAYIIVALAPVVAWGLAFDILMLVCDNYWFWIIAVLQALNLGGAAGDYYVTIRILKMPKTTLAHDTGTSMVFYGKDSQE